MGRIRTIKPEFPQSETVGKLSRDARLLFIQLWTFVDDEGRARAASRMLASLLYPYDDDAPELIDAWLGELEQNDCLRRYEVEGTKYLEIINWSKHQKVDHPSKSRIPPFSRELAKPSRSLAPDLGPRTSTKDHLESHSSETAKPVAARETRDSPGLGLAALETKLREAAGWENESHPQLLVVGPIMGLIEGGANLEIDVLPVVRAVAPKAKPVGWKYFVGPIKDAITARHSARAPPSDAVTAERERKRQEAAKRLADHNQGHAHAG